MSWSHRATELAKGGLVLIGLAVAFGVVVWLFGLSHRRTCDRLDGERVSHLLPGHVTAGPGSIYVIGIEPGPPPSQLIPYLEAAEAMDRAGCDLPGQ